MSEDLRTPATTDGEKPPTDGETHATTGGAAAAGAIVAGAIGLTGGPLAAAVGAVGGAIVGAAAERLMHSEDDSLEPPAPPTESDSTGDTSPGTDAPSKNPD